MSFIIKELIKNKIRHLTVAELLHFAHQYGFSLTEREAHQILQYIQTEDLDIFSKEAIEEVYEKIAEITDPQTATKARKLFEQLIVDFGVAHYFE